MAAVGLGLLMGVPGVAHTADVIGSKLRHGKPYDFRFVGLIANGLILIYSSALHIGVSRWLRQGCAWAVAISASAALFQLIYLLVLLPIPAPARRMAILLQGCYLCFLLLQWNVSRETPGRHTILQTGSRLGLISTAIQLVLTFVPLAILAGPIQQGSFTVATFLAGPAYGWMLAAIFALVVWFGRQHWTAWLEGQRVSLSIGMMATGVVLLTGLFRAALELYLRAVSGGEIRLVHPTVTDVFVYGAMLAAVMVSEHRHRWRPVRPAEQGPAV